MTVDDDRRNMLFKAAFESLAICQDDHITLANDAFYALLGNYTLPLKLTTLIPLTYNSGIIERMHHNPGQPINVLCQHHNKTFIAAELRVKNLDGQMVLSLRDLNADLYRAQQVYIQDNLYRTLARHLPNTGVVVFDAAMRYLIAEGELLDKLHLDRSRVEGRTFHEIKIPTSEANRQLLYDGQQRALNGEMLREQLITRHHIFEVEFVPINTMRGMMVIRDMTAMQRVQRELTLSEHRFRGLFDHNNDAVFFIDLNGYIIDLNQQALYLLGYNDRKAQIGQQATINIVQESRDEGENIRQSLLDGESVPIYERMFQRQDGYIFPVEINVALVRDANGQPSHFQSIIRDISERKRFEAQLAQRINQLEMLHEIDSELARRLDLKYVGMMALDNAMRLSGADAGFLALRDDEQVLRLTNINGAYDKDLIEGHLVAQIGINGRALRTDRAQRVVDVLHDADYVAYRQRTQAQIAIPMLIGNAIIGLISLEFDEADKASEEAFNMVLLVVGRIVSAVENAQLYRHTQSQLEQLRDMHEQLTRLEKLKTDMIRVAAHDLRNPLSALIGYVELVSEELQQAAIHNAEIDHMLNHMRQATSRMNRIVSDILSLKRIEEAAARKDYPVIDITPIIHNTFDEFALNHSEGDHHLSASIPDDPLYIRGDRAELTEVIANLLDNAIKYTPSGGTVTLNVTTDAQRMALTVVDTGYGIPQEKQDKLFEAFYRAKTYETRHIDGTGLGLHLVKNIIERHKGEIIFSSVHQQGSTFGFYLPLSNT